MIQEKPDNEEHTLSAYIIQELMNKVDANLEVKIRKSPKSKSRYLYISYQNKGVGVRISDHMGSPMSIKAIKFYTKKQEVTDFYFYTSDLNINTINNTISNIVQFFRSNVCTS